MWKLYIAPYQIIRKIIENVCVFETIIKVRYITSTLISDTDWCFYSCFQMSVVLYQYISTDCDFDILMSRNVIQY